MQPYGQLGAYKNNQRNGESPRETDAHALLSCASRLERVRDPSSDYHTYCEAIRHNQKLWVIFQVCITQEDNPLPQDIKVLLFKLGEYVQRTSIRLIASRDLAKLDSLIDINRQIAAGLSARPAGEQGEVEALPLPSAEPMPIMTTI